MPLGGRTSNNTNKLKIFSLETEVEAIDIYGYKNIDPEITYDFYGEPKLINDTKKFNRKSHKAGHKKRREK